MAEYVHKPLTVSSYCVNNQKCKPLCPPPFLACLRYSVSDGIFPGIFEGDGCCLVFGTVTISEG